MKTLVSEVAHLVRPFTVAVIVSTVACDRNVPAVLPDASTPSTVMGEMTAAVPIDQPATLISEADFLAALNEREASSASAGSVGVAARVAALANSPAALGAFGEVDPDRTDFSGDFFVVARDASRGHGDRFVETRDFYLAHVRLSGRAAWVVRRPHLALDSDVPFPTRGTCGLLEAPGGRNPCPGPGCPPEDFRMGTAVAESGTLGTSRVRLHVFDPSGFLLWICQPFERTPDRQLPPDLGVVNSTEICNGRDDDSDGSIDENAVCANRNTSCSAALWPPATPTLTSPPVHLAAWKAASVLPGGAR